MIRLPDIPGLPQTAIGAPTVSPPAAAAPGVALGDLASSIRNTSEHFHGLAVETQKRENARTLSEIRQQIAKSQAEFSLKLDSDPDPTSRIAKTQEFLSAEKIRIQGMNDGDLPPAVRDQALAFYEESATRYFIDQNAAAARLADKRARLALSNEITTATDNSDRASLDTAIATATDSGVLLPEEAAPIVHSFERKQSAGILEAAISEDPAEVLKDIEAPDFLTRFPGITKNDLPELKDRAEHAKENHRAEQLQLLNDALTVGRLQPDDIEAATYLTPLDVEKVKTALAAKQNAKPPTPEQHGKAWDMLLELREKFADPAMTDKEYAARWNDARADVIGIIATTPPAFRADITGELERRSPANRSAEKLLPPVGTDRTELKAIAIARITRARAANMLGNAAEDATPAEREKAYRTAEALRLKVSQWIENNADERLDLQKVEEFTDSLISGDRVKSTVRDLAPMVPGSAQRLRPAPAPPVLPPKQGTKDKATADPLQIPSGDGTASADLLPSKQLDTFLDQ